MPRIAQDEQPRGTTGGGNYSETPEQKRGWQKLADWIEDQVAEGLLSQDDTFTVKGYVHSIDLDEGGKYFSKDITDRKSGEKKKMTFTKATAVITDPRFTEAGVPLPLPRKDLGTSFFDGRGRDGKRGIARGAMWHLHRAVTFAEPPQELIDNKGSWDTEDYTGRDHPVLLVVTFAGWEPEGSQYADSRAGLRVFLSHFDRDVESRKARQEGRTRPQAAVAEVSGNEFDGEDVDVSWVDDATDPHGAMAQVLAPPTRRGRTAAASAGAAAPAAVASTATASPERAVASTNERTSDLATERQVRFIYAIGREAGLDDQEVTGWSQELYGQDIESLNRRDASALIEALQRRRNEVA